MMLQVEEALARIRETAAPLAARYVSISDALGCALAEDVVSDIDSPPYDKALMDGYAVRSEDCAAAPVELSVLEQVTAGQTPRHALSLGQSTRIMTGAPLPKYADAVVMVERTEELSDGRVRIDDANVARERNVLRQATVMRRGQQVLEHGSLVSPAVVGLLAEVGRSEALVTPRPRVAVLSTGDELVPCEKTPGPGQIRNSNGPMLCAQISRAGGLAVNLGIAGDDRDTLRSSIQEGLSQDLLVLSGGVSAGVADLVPQVLADCGVSQVFHKVHLKPGKPLWFGATEGGVCVFGLPGNPVSSLVCFELFVREAIRLRAGLPAADEIQRLPLVADRAKGGDRPTWWPSRRVTAPAGVSVEPLKWLGSADLKTLAAADCLALFPAGGGPWKAGDAVECRTI